ncbi:hypothetical protein FIU88_05645 [Halomonas sp. THAF12]|uniref:hypothetical protein n=1 Tax=Halomonas sp. THAF12 TaxID=2587849 RepID=UPI001267C5C7|nr:hypothetical protein [Halomonas sp. THAF12]QFT84462.1 hypothetical protein FIU88_05645 [Halomonas sp. THAF12]
MLNDTLSRLWLDKSDLEQRAHQLRQAGHTTASRELGQAAYRLGNQLIEVEAVVQEFAAELAATDQPTAPIAEALPAQQEAH